MKNESVRDFQKVESCVRQPDAIASPPSLTRILAGALLFVAPLALRASPTDSQPMPNPRPAAVSKLLRNGPILVGGGSNSPDRGAAAEAWDQGSASWPPTGPMAVAREFPVVERFDDGRIFVAGGSTRQGDTALSSAEIFDPASGRWTLLPSMAFARQNAASLLLADGRVAVLGGFDGVLRQSHVEVFDPVTGEWTSFPDMSTPRSGCVAVLLRDQRWLVAGGRSDDGGTISSVEIFDPVARTWASGPSMMVAREFASALLLGDGQVYVTGGESDELGFLIRGAEIFDPTTSIWTLIPGKSGGPIRASSSPNDARLPVAATNLTAPTLTTLTLSTGAKTTLSALVSLDHTILGALPTEYLASENSGFSMATWKPWSPIPTFSLSSGRDTKTVYFKLRNAAGESRTMSNSIFFDPQISIGFFAIAGGKPVTKSLAVTLDHGVVGYSSEFLASENPDFAGAVWQPEADRPAFCLVPGSGTRTVFLKVRQFSIESAVASDTIRYNGK